MKTRANSPPRLPSEPAPLEREGIRKSLIVPRAPRSLLESVAFENATSGAPSSISSARAIELYCPFAAQLHPDVERVQRGSVEWASRMGFIRSDEHREKLERSKLARLPARAFPTAERAVLQLAADWTTLFCLLDDHLEGRADDPLALSGYLTLLHQAFAGELVNHMDPIIRAIGDLRSRFARLTDGPTLRRFVRAFRELLNGYVWEGVNRWSLLKPGQGAYHAMRQITIGLRPQFVLGEMAFKIRLRPGLRKDPSIVWLESLTCSAVGCANDLFTCVKEFGSDHAHNIVLLLLNEESRPFDEVIRSVAVMHDELVSRFENVERTLSKRLAADDNVRRYVEMLRACIRSHLEWARESERYAGTSLDIVEERRALSFG